MLALMVFVWLYQGDGGGIMNDGGGINNGGGIRNGDDIRNDSDISNSGGMDITVVVCGHLKDMHHPVTAKSCLWETILQGSPPIFRQRQESGMCISGRVCTKSKKMSPVFLNVSVFSDGRHKGGQYFATENSMVGDEDVVNNTKNPPEHLRLLPRQWENLKNTVQQMNATGGCRYWCGACKTGCC